jgi:hypothetical protein
MVGRRADAADIRRNASHLLCGPAYAKPLEAAQFKHLPESVSNIPMLIKDNLDPAVPFKPGDRVYDDPFRHGFVFS